MSETSQVVGSLVYVMEYDYSKMEAGLNSSYKRVSAMSDSASKVMIATMDRAVASFADAANSIKEAMESQARSSENAASAAKEAAEKKVEATRMEAEAVQKAKAGKLVAAEKEAQAVKDAVAKQIEASFALRRAQQEEADAFAKKVRATDAARQVSYNTADATAKQEKYVKELTTALAHNAKVEAEYAAAKQKYSSDMVRYNASVREAAREQERMASFRFPQGLIDSFNNLKESIGDLTLRGWSMNSMMQGLLGVIGVGSAMQLVSTAVSHVARSFEEVKEQAKQANQDAIELNKTYTELHNTMLRFSTRYDAVKMLEEVNRELVRAREETQRLSDVQTRIGKDRGKIQSGVYGPGDSRTQLVGRAMPETEGENFQGSVLRHNEVEIVKALEAQYKKASEEMAASKNRELALLAEIEKKEESLRMGRADASLEQKLQDEQRSKSVKEYLKGVLEPQLASEGRKRKAYEAEQQSLSELRKAIEEAADPALKLQRDIEKVNIAQSKGAITAKQQADEIERLRRAFETPFLNAILANQQAMDAEAEKQQRLKERNIDRFQQAAEIQAPEDNGQIARLQREKQELTKHYQALGEIKVNYTKAYNDKVKKLDEDLVTATKMRSLQQQAVLLDSFGQLINGLGSLMAEGSRAAKAFFIASKMISIAQAYINTELAATRAMAEGGFIMGIPMSTAIRAMGYASIAVMAAQTIASFEGGGLTPDGPRSGGMDGKGGMLAMLHPNEKVVDLTKDQPVSGKATGFNVVINNYGNDEVTATPSADGKTLNVIVKQVARQIANDIENGGGTISTSLERNYRLSRGRQAF